MIIKHFHKVAQLIDQKKQLRILFISLPYHLFGDSRYLDRKGCDRFYPLRFGPGQVGFLCLHRR